MIILWIGQCSSVCCCGRTALLCGCSAFGLLKRCLIPREYHLSQVQIRTGDTVAAVDFQGQRVLECTLL
jgi:hypothetical protein